MVSKKQVKLIFSGLVLLISLLAIIFSDSPSKLSAPFENESSQGPESFSGREQDDVYVEEVLGQALLPSEAPILTFVPEENMEESPIDTSGEQVYEDGHKVIKVVDGDTIDVEIEGKIERLRLIGIDTPETVDPRKKVQCFGKEASDKAKELLGGQLVTLESDETQGEKDKYKRLLRYVILPDGTNLNLFMITEGYAHEYTYDEPYKYQAEFKQAEISARENSKGLWNPTICPN